MSGFCPACGGTLTAAGDCRSCQLGLVWDEDEPEPAGPAEPADGGRRFGSYDLLEIIGRGGMGTVYRARQRGTDRLVALKMMQLQHLPDAEIQARFRSEVRHAASLTHPHILPLYEVGHQDGVPFFSMKLAERGSLADPLRAGPLPPREGAELVASIARAVHHAHQHGILHRDLKPGNILLDADGKPYVGDFGLARALDDAPSLTLTGVILGTPQYMAPEQAGGDPRAAGVASDVYSLGAVLYHALTGRAPFQGETPVSILRRVIDEAPVPLRTLQAGVARDLEIICLKALEKAPAGRYLSAAALADDLERWLGGQTILARPATPAERAWRWARRNRALAAVSVSLALLLLATTIGSTLAASRLAQAGRAAQVELHRAQILEARATRRSGRAGHRLESLATLEKAAGARATREVRDEVAAALALEDVRVLSRRPIVASALPTLAFDATLSRYSCQGVVGGLSLHATDDGRELALFRDARAEPFLEINFGFSPDGRFLAARFLNGKTVVWEAEGGRVVFDWSGDTALRPVLAFSPDNRHVAYTPASGGVQVFDLADGANSAPQVIDSEPFVIQGLAYSPDGRRLAFADEGHLLQDRSGPRARPGRLRIVDLASGTSICEVASSSGWVVLAWHPSGERIAVANGRGDVLILDATTGQERQSLRGHRSIVVGLAYDRSGERIISSGLDSTTRLWDADSGTERWLLPGADPCFRVAREGDRVGFNLDGNTAAVLQLIHSDVLRTWQPPAVPGPPLALDFSRDGKLLGLASFGLLRVLEVATGRLLPPLELPGRRRASLWFDPVANGVYGSSLDEGVFYWPYTLAADGPRFGERQARPIAGGNLLSFLSRDGRLAGMVTIGGAQGQAVVALDGSRPAIPLDTAVGLGMLSISPDGRFVARGSWQPRGIRVWDLNSGKIVAELENGQQAFVFFSADGRWLLTRTAEAARFWNVPDWSAGPVVPSEWREIPSAPADFSAAGGLLALIQGPERVQILDAADGTPLIQLESPIPLTNNRVRFSPDGSQVAMVGENHGVQLWDLRALRRELAARGVDWPEPAAR